MPILKTILLAPMILTISSSFVEDLNGFSLSSSRGNLFGAVNGLPEPWRHFLKVDINGIATARMPSPTNHALFWDCPKSSWPIPLFWTFRLQFFLWTNIIICVINSHVLIFVQPSLTWLNSYLISYLLFLILSSKAFDLHHIFLPLNASNKNILRAAVIVLGWIFKAFLIDEKGKNYLQQLKLSFVQDVS